MVGRLLTPFGAFVLGSVLVHAAAAALLVTNVAPIAPTPSQVSEQVPITFVSIPTRDEQVTPTMDDVIPAVPESVELTPGAAEPATTPLVRRYKTPAMVQHAHAQDSKSIRAANATGEASSNRTPRRSVIGPSLSPQSVAKGALAIGPLRSRLDGQREALDSYLYEAANQKRALSVRPSPRLTKTKKGGLRYDGPRFDAEIFPDGTVRFSDTAGVTLYGDPKDFKDWLKTPPPDLSEPRLAQATTIDGQRANVEGQRNVPQTLKITGSFDVMDAIMRARGQDPYYAERAWFMRQTKGARNRLARKFKKRTGRYAAIAAVRRAKSLWKKKRSMAEGRRQLFRLWDDCAEGDIGQQARVQLMHFINRVTQAKPFTSEELKRLNAGRQSKNRFTPNQSPTSGQ